MPLLVLSIIQGVLFVNVGYSAHCMRPHTGNFLDSLAAPSPSSGGKEGEEGGKAKAKGWCVASFDWAGSGYSQGVRCLYNGPDLVADLLQFVELVRKTRVHRWFGFKRCQED